MNFILGNGVGVLDMVRVGVGGILGYTAGVIGDLMAIIPLILAIGNNVKMALDVARESRQILGAMGITGDFPMMRHMMNLESVITYEGTHDIHLLITGADITGESAFV